MTGLRYKLENWYVFLDNEDTYTAVKLIQWSTLLLSYYRMNFSGEIRPKNRYVKGSNFKTTYQKVNILLQCTHFI